MRFVNTKRFSPIVYGSDLPHDYDLFHYRPAQIPKTKKEREKFYKDNNIVKDREWWKKQRFRCVYGYTVEDAVEPGGDAFPDGELAFWDGDDCHIPLYGLVFKDRAVHITGRHYFYLNFWPIYGLLDGCDLKGFRKPRFLDLDYFFARRLEMMFEQEKDGQDLKGRQLGFSYKTSGMCLGYNYTFVKSSVNIIVAGVQEDADNTFANCERGLDSLINTQFYKQRAEGGDNSALIQSVVDGAEIRSLTAKDNPQTASRFSPYFVLHEEVGKGKKGWSISTASYIDPSTRATKKKTGYQLYIGTAGKMGEGIVDLEERHYHPDKYNILSFPDVFDEEINYEMRVGHVTNKWMFWIIDDEGNSLKKESIKDIQENIIDKAVSKDKYIKITQYPIYASNIFMIDSGGFFGKEISLLLQRRRNYIRTHPEENIVMRGVLDWIDPERPYEGVKWMADANGWLSIIEKPETDKDGRRYYNLYEAGTDSYDQDEARTSDSKGATRVRKMYKPGSKFYNCSVAWIIERPTVEEGGAELFYEHSAMLCMWYNCKNNIEYSNLRIFDWYKNHGLELLLKERPRLAFASKLKETRVTNPYGTDKSLKPHILAIARDVLDEEYISRMYFKEEIEALLKYKYDPTGKRYNCDITIAFAEAEVSAKEGEFNVVVSQEDVDKANKNRGILVYVNNCGVLMPKFV